MCACKLPGTQSFRIHLSDTSLSTKSASISDEAPDLSLIPEEYHDYADVFDKAKSMQLAPHRPYDLKIDLEEGASPPIVPMYPLSQVELKTLQEFIDEHLRTGFIQSSSSPHRAPVLFAHKKDGSLHLCIDFQGLNWISKKDQYPLLTSYPRRAKPAFTPQLISGTLITWFTLWKATNEKPPFGPATAPLNGLSCLSG